MQARPESTSSLYEPYKAKCGLRDQKTNVIYNWLCSCDKGPEDMNGTIKCTKTDCSFWGHLLCYGFKTSEEAKNAKYFQCYDCRSQPRICTNKLWTKENHQLLMKLKNEEKYEWIRIARALHRTENECKNEYKIINEKNNNNTVNENNENDNENNNTANENKNKNKYDLRQRKKFNYNVNIMYGNLTKDESDSDSDDDSDSDYTCDNNNNNAKKNKDFECNNKKKKAQKKCQFCNKVFKNGYALGGHMTAHTKKKKKSINTDKNNNKRMEKRKRKNCVIMQNNGKKHNKRNKKIKRKMKESDNYNPNNNNNNCSNKEPPNKKMKLSSNNNNNNNNDEIWEELPAFNTWNAKETFVFLVNEIPEFKKLMAKDDGLKAKWQKVNGEQLAYAAKKGHYNWLKSNGIDDLLQMKIMDAVKESKYNI